jgi:hypothetical protein
MVFKDLRGALFRVAGLSFTMMAAGCTPATHDDAGDGETVGDGDGDGDGEGDGDLTDDGDGDPSGDGDGDPTGDGDCEGDLPLGATCTSPCMCASGNCYNVPILGGQCSECDEDDDCPDGGCTAPNPFENNGATCNMGELGGGCESDAVCQADLLCGQVLDLLGLFEINTCGVCKSSDDCDPGLICAPDVVVEDFAGHNACMAPGSLAQDKYCILGPPGDEACAGVCSTVDIMGLAKVGACGECQTDDDCGGGTCKAGEFILATGELFGSVCVD